MLSNQTSQELVTQKMQELCALLLEQESFKQLRQMIDDFAADEASVAQYEQFMYQHQALQQKEMQDEALSQAEMDEYEQEELALYDNDIIRKFLYAQREFSHMHQTVSNYFTKTVELNRLPEPSDFKKSACGCGGNCGCGSGH